MRMAVRRSITCICTCSAAGRSGPWFRERHKRGEALTSSPPYNRARIPSEGVRYPERKRILRAELISRSCETPHSVHIQLLIPRSATPFGPVLPLQNEQIREENDSLTKLQARACLLSSPVRDLMRYR